MTSMVPPRPDWAYGIDPYRTEKYSLRQARYQRLAEAVAAYVRERNATPLRLLDVGVWDGVSRRHLDQHPEATAIEYHGVDLVRHSKLYRADEWHFHPGDLQSGLTDLASNAFDIVICEQVLEHLGDPQRAMQTLNRVLRPGGLLVVGVPVFTPGWRLVRQHLVPLLDRWSGRTRRRTHIQFFTVRQFRQLLREYSDVRVIAERGVRLISGGPFRRLENHRWFWSLNRLGGEWFPGLCPEIQIVAIKNGIVRPESLPRSPVLNLAASSKTEFAATPAVPAMVQTATAGDL